MYPPSVALERMPRLELESMRNMEAHQGAEAPRPSHLELAGIQFSAEALAVAAEG